MVTFLCYVRGISAERIYNDTNEPEVPPLRGAFRVLGAAGSSGGSWDGRVAGSQVSSGENLRKEGSD